MMNTLGELGFADCHGANRNPLVVTALRFPDSIAQASLVRDPRRQARYRLACAGVFPLSFSFLRVLSGAFQTDNSVWPRAYPFRVVPNYAPGDRPWGVIRASRRCAIDDPGMKQAPTSLDLPADLETPISAPAVKGRRCARRAAIPGPARAISASSGCYGFADTRGARAF